MSSNIPDPVQQPHSSYTPQAGAPGAHPDPERWSAQRQPAPQPRRSWFARHKVLTGLGVLAALGFMGAALGGGGAEEPGPAGVVQTTQSNDGNGTAKKPGGSKSEKPAGIGDKIRDGKFEFTVTELETGVRRIGDEFLNEKAQGRFVLVHVTVENIGDEAQFFDGSSQKLIDTEGRTHSADTEAAIYLDDSNSFLNDINPGNAVDGVVVFDIPKGATPATLELHDSAFSGGATVVLD